MADHNPQHGRRPHFHRGRRGPDRRGTDRRTPPPHAAEPGREAPRDGSDVEQIMREIRSRIAQRHGIELTAPQIQELAARRLEAILEPRNIKPQLLEQLRKSAGAAPDVPETPRLETYTFEDTTLYETHRGLLRFFRRLLNPILKLFFNPTPLAAALNTQSRINKALIERDAERDRRQSEWNALHYELVQRVVIEMARISVEMQALSAKIESLSAKVDFNERRVRGLETVPPPSARPQQPRREESRREESRRDEPRRDEPRRDEPRRDEPRRDELVAAPAAGPAESVASGEGIVPAEGTGEGQRRRRRRRRGRRSSGGAAEATPPADANAQADLDDVDGVEGEGDDEEAAPLSEAQPIAAPPPPTMPEPAPWTPQPAPQPEWTPPPEPAADLAPEPATYVAPPPAPDTAAPAAGPASTGPAEHVVPSPPRDEPVPANPIDRNEPGPEDR
jgi:hypothetical protein